LDQADSIWADVDRIRRAGADGAAEAFGLGRLIGRDLVLTARHVLETKDGRALGDDG
jgi:hypothetical protein